MPFGKSFLSLISLQSPFSPGLELVVLQWKVIVKTANKKDLSRAETRHRVSLVVVDQESSGHTVCVEGSS